MKLVSKKNTAVSPVIGTILLVAITVVLVAIIAAVVMPMVSNNLGQLHATGIQTITKNDTMTITIISGEVPVKIEADGTILEGSIIDTNKLKIGGVCDFTIVGDGIGSITATYADGTSQVIWSGKVAGA